MSKEKFSFLNPLLQNQLRLTIMSILIGIKKANFSYLKEKTEATDGNLSTQITKLEAAGYIEVKKEFKNKFPNTVCSITKLGIEEFDKYFEALKSYVNHK